MFPVYGVWLPVYGVRCTRSNISSHPCAWYLLSTRGERGRWLDTPAMVLSHLGLFPTHWPTNPKFAKLWPLSGLVFLSGIYNFAHIHWLLTSHPRLFLLILLISEGNAIGGQ